jgi:hypothetical protein
MGGPRGRQWPYDFACELDASPSDEMRAIVERAINKHSPRPFSRCRSLMQATSS